MIDTHSHLFCEEFDEDRAEVVNRARVHGVGKVVMPNIDSQSAARLLDMCREYPGYCYPAMGVHPTSVTDANLQQELQIVRQYLESMPGTFVAIGEIGLDLYWDRTFLKEQLAVLSAQLDWALEFDLPVIIHCREAWDELFACMESYKNTKLKGVFHSFTGTAAQAAEALKYTGFCFGVNGVVTFKKSALPEVLRQIPVERILLETDSPYLAPVPNRGKRNESAFVPLVLHKLAEIYGRTDGEIEKITDKNASELFGWKN